jgi:tetratricopeptide (TPR) repeat protein
LGYYYFHDAIAKHGSFANAKRIFSDSINSGDFKGPSYYLLAVISRLEQLESGSPLDLKEAEDYLNEGLKYDPNYASLHMELGLIYVLTQRQDLAIKELKEACRIYKYHCYTVTQNSRDSKHPLYAIRDKPEFKKLEADCESETGAPPELAATSVNK